MADTDPGTKALVERVKAGDRVAQDSLVLRHRVALKHHIVRTASPAVLREQTPDEIADVAQAEAIASIQEFEYRGPGSWLALIVKKATWDILDISKGLKRAHRKKQKLTPFTEEHELPIAHTAGVGTKAHEKAEVERLHLVMSSLADHERDILLLRFFDELPVHEIAKRLKIPKSTAFDRLNQASASFEREWNRRNR